MEEALSPSAACLGGNLLVVSSKYLLSILYFSDTITYFNDAIIIYLIDLSLIYST